MGGCRHSSLFLLLLLLLPHTHNIHTTHNTWINSTPDHSLIL